VPHVSIGRRRAEWDGDGWKNFKFDRRLIDESLKNIRKVIFLKRENFKDQVFKSALGVIYQTFDGEELYPSIEEKAANLLYFVVKKGVTLGEPLNKTRSNMTGFLFISIIYLFF
jgi:hypothetical protein